MKTLKLYRVLVMAGLMLLGSLSLVAQEPAKKGDAEEKRLTFEEVIETYKLEGKDVRRIESGNPGDEPDPEVIWVRDGRPFKIRAFPVGFGTRKYSDEGWVRPYRHINADMEIYRENEETVWVWYPVSLPPKEHVTDPEVYRRRGFTPEEVARYEDVKRNFVEVVPPKTDQKIVFIESSEGLPTDGSWRNAADFADMNGDGHLDLVTPPQRGGMASLRPYIFLGDGKGGWTRWSGTSWSRGLNYGSVAAEDFNRDGHVDLVFAIHLTGIAVLHGDGKGNFVDGSKGLPTDFSTRRVVPVELNGDEWIDLVGISEGPTMHDQKPSVPYHLRVFLNDQGNGWQERFVTDANKKAMGDALSTGDLNGDGRPDFVTASIVFGAPDVLYLSEGEGAYRAADREDFVPMSYYLGNVVAPFRKGAPDVAVYSFTRHWIESINPAEVPHPDSLDVVGLEMVAVENGKVVRTPIATWPGKFAIRAVGSGDFDGDGNRDIVFVGKPGDYRVFILLGDGSGGFREAVVEGPEIPVNTTYDVTVDDIDGDGLDDIAMLFENTERVPGKRDGSVRVYLNRTGR